MNDEGVKHKVIYIHYIQHKNKNFKGCVICKIKQFDT